MTDSQPPRETIRGHHDVRDAYRDATVASEYVSRRFDSALGRLLHARQVRAVTDLITRHRIRQAMEIAPGPARVTVDVAPFLERVTMLDASHEMLSEAGRRLAARGQAAHRVQADAFHLPVRATVPLVYSFRFIRHFDRADRLRIYSQVSAVLAPRGWLVFDAVNEVVSAPLRARAGPGEYRHFDALLRPDEIRAELAEGGFADVTLEGVQHRFETLVACQSFLGPRFPALARAAIAAIDRSGGEPLEWIVTCRRA
jgi:SAM-dependent methyltransferase